MRIIIRRGGINENMVSWFLFGYITLISLRNIGYLDGMISFRVEIYRFVQKYVLS